MQHMRYEKAYCYDCTKTKEEKKARKINENNWLMLSNLHSDFFYIERRIARGTEGSVKFPRLFAL